MQAVIGLGSNQGDRRANLASALNALERLPLVAEVRASGIYQTPPFKVSGEQQDFYNCCALIASNLSPEALLGACLGIEAAMGRTRTEGLVDPRIIDLDLLLYEGEERQSNELTLPHPRIAERAFVLLPLRELFPALNVFGFDYSAALNSLDTSGIYSLTT
ncbi:MAG: 2-amino-4-hydroxy-6-hydroxymethyldihydropteridine diphosphokinase [Oscillospiraceae bacterium]|jgi:2-amino-4-hydroxy-6-hydroxymethyldihydropteridine diphosphokinase|nr:2-amino-4-hydroxy-6-hydroxymethyldihydropteridine diphosphokinase [Oscillospiraceae bacterium]